ncbi:MAG: sucrase ferredoxin [Nitriliruptorales bacterium]|nr:sucrase ferredoxin [Nitriliruptorales bacterium]
MSERFSCALHSQALGEPICGTASQVRRWILVEQPGTWGVDAVFESGLPIDVATRLRAVARAAGARLLLIRRHGRTAAEQRTCFGIVSTADVRRVERFAFDDPAELLAIDWAVLRAGEPAGGEVSDDPVYLVCTNGRHDVCCARFGRPVAQALSAAVGDHVWESSHFGGDRFAGNLVCLPDGIYYGRVAAVDAAGLVNLHRAGSLDLPHYRGRSFQPFVAQAAECFVREEHGMIAVDEVVANQVDALGDDTFDVTLQTSAGSTLVATVQSHPASHPQQLTCRSPGEEHPPRYRLVALRSR